MGFGKYLKRVGKYIIKGVPHVNITANLSTINYGGLLKDKTVLVTGGARGLGYYFAKKCLSEGARVIITGRDIERLNEAKKQFGEKCYVEQFDICDVDNVDDFAKRLFNVYGNVDCVVSNAGVSLHEGDISKVTIEGYDKQFDTNVRGAYFLAKSYLKYRDRNKSSSYIFISSERGFQCDNIPYGLTKASINSLTKGLARKFYRDNIRFNAIAPGITATEMTGRDPNGNMHEEAQVAGRFFLPEEVAEVVAFLLSDASKCISGEVIACDAGQYISSYY